MFLQFLCFISNLISIIIITYMNNFTYPFTRSNKATRKKLVTSLLQNWI